MNTSHKHHKTRLSHVLLFAGLMILSAVVPASAWLDGNSTLVASADTGQGDSPQESPTEAMQDIDAHGLNNYSCNSNEWHFVINQIRPNEGEAPGSITVSWDNGAEEEVGLSRQTGQTAHYITTSNLDARVTSASTQIYSSWSGQFVLSHGPCGPVETDTPVPTDTPQPPTNTAVPSATNTPQATSTATGTGVAVTNTPTSCNCPQDVTVVQGLSVSGNTIQVTLRNNSSTCSHLVGIATYEWPTPNFEDQVLFDYEQYTLAPGETRTLSASLPDCTWQADAFCGEVIQSFQGGVRYGSRLLDDDLGGSNSCEPGTSTPTNTAVATNTPTDTPVPPSNTPVPPTNTNTNTPVPPSNTPVPPTNTAIVSTPTNTSQVPPSTPTDTPQVPPSTPTNTPQVPLATSTDTPVAPVATTTPTVTSTATTSVAGAVLTPTPTQQVASAVASPISPSAGVLPEVGAPPSTVPAAPEALPSTGTGFAVDTLLVLLAMLALPAVAIGIYLRRRRMHSEEFKL